LQEPAANQQPANYGLAITVPAADRSALTAITTKAYRSRDSIATIVAGKTWGVANVAGPFTGRFEIPARSANQALRLQRTLIPSAWLPPVPHYVPTLRRYDLRTAVGTGLVPVPVSA
jgi:hypothetical protein